MDQHNGTSRPAFTEPSPLGRATTVRSFDTFSAAARADAGLTADELGRLVGVSGDVVRWWEAGEVFPTPGVLVELCRVTGVCVVDAVAALPTSAYS